MVADIEFLTIYSEMVLGTVAFMAIVATLRQTLGESLTAYQYLITRFFIDVGLVLVFISVAGLGIFSIYPHPALVWNLMAWMLLAYYTFYLPYYLSRRRKLNVPRTITATAVVIATAISSTNLVLAVFGLIPVIVSAAVVIHMVVCLGSMVGIFLVFVGSFMDFDETMF
jgi:hypothetical protein